MSFQQALSGLNAASKNLDVIGNNVSNANTVGSKVARAEFADQYANALYGAASNAIGIGTQVSAVAQQFTQGDLTTTSNPLDLAINGQGFFRIDRGGAIEYTRNGQLKLDSSGYIVTNQGGRLTGYGVDASGKAGGAPTPIKLSTGNIAPQATGADGGGALELNLDERVQFTSLSPTFSPADSKSYAGTTTMNVYDQVGEAHTLALYFRPQSATSVGVWNVYATVDGANSPAGATPAAVGTINFKSDGTFDNIDGTAGKSKIDIELQPGASAPADRQQVPFDFSAVTQYGYDFGVTKLTQDGYASGRLTDFTIDEDGTILSRYSNGQTKAQAQIALTNFTNPQGLAPIGGNSWIQTSSSGQPIDGKPATGNLGALKSGAVENSNIDLTAELVNMITAQRIYQANAQTIRTQDQVMQTIVNLR